MFRPRRLISSVILCFFTSKVFNVNYPNYDTIVAYGDIIINFCAIEEL